MLNMMKNTYGLSKVSYSGVSPLGITMGDTIPPGLHPGLWDCGFSTLLLNLKKSEITL